MSINRMGRPAHFRNAAEKQKAYRERKKQADADAEALRKSQWENSLEGLKAKEDQASQERADHLSKLRTMYQWATDIDKDYHIWLVRDIALCDAWWQAHCRWYDAWKLAGFPKRTAEVR